MPPPPALLLGLAKQEQDGGSATVMGVAQDGAPHSYCQQDAAAAPAAAAATQSYCPQDPAAMNPSQGVCSTATALIDAPPLPAPPPEASPATANAAPLSEVLLILQTLEHKPISLRLLEATQVGSVCACVSALVSPCQLEAPRGHSGG